MCVYVAYREGDGDVASDVFARTLRYREHRERYDRRKGEPAAWLIGISRRCIADAVKARLELTEPDDLVAAGDLAEDSALRLDVAHAVATLDERNRELIALRYGADLTAKQIAEVLGVKTNAVEVALHRALGRLKVILDPSTPTSPSRMTSEAEGSAPS